MPSKPVPASEIAAVRRFNRFYTQRIGALVEGLLDSGLTLTEARVLYELADAEDLTASGLARDLGLDQGYLSRILARFARQGLLHRAPLPGDRRQSVLTLTTAGRAAFDPLDRASQARFGAMLGALPAADRQDLLQALANVETLLGDRCEHPAESAVRLRPQQIGDIGWIVHRQALIYATEYGWDESFEALLSEIGARFLRDFVPAREACWVAIRDGTVLGAVFLVQARQDDGVTATADTGQLRMLYVEPEARGLGIGRRLVDACVRRAREVGYARLILWTNDNLHAARRIYQRCGFTLTAEEPHHSFGQDLVGQFWELELELGRTGRCPPPGVGTRLPWAR